MSDYKPTGLTPSKPTPNPTFDVLGGNSSALSDLAGENFALVLFYRGLHCPKCRDNLQDMNKHVADFAATGTKIIAVSMDPEDRASESKSEWGLDKISIAHSLSLDEAKNWGLHISSGRGKTSTGHEETKIFNEPGTFLIRADGTLYASWVQTVPFARPGAADLLSMIKFVNEKDYPPRGTHTEV